MPHALLSHPLRFSRSSRAPLAAAVSRLWALVVTALLAVAGTAFAQQAPSVGEVAMAMGDVLVTRAGASANAAPARLRAGDLLHEGDQLVSGADGHVYIRSVDGGFISLRPNSRLRFEVYRVDRAEPSQSRFRMVLEQGVMRSISGPGVKAARERYRLNTPVAAIGLRGTDFSVYADAEVTRVSVRDGGVVMAAFGGACQPVGLGPCEGGNARDLFADRTTLMQLRRGEAIPSVFDAGRLPGPDRMAPPLPDENGAAAKPGKTSSHGGPAHAAATEIGDPLAPGAVLDQEAMVGQRLESSVGAQLSPGGPLPDPGTPPGPGAGPGDPVGPPTGPPLQWGRWRDLASAGPGVSLATLTAQGQKIVALNPLFALLRDPAAANTLPRAGVFSFQLAAHEGYLYNASRNTAVPSKVDDAALTIDFDQSRFSTRLGLSTATRSTVIQAQGRVYASGELIHDSTRSNGVVTGLVGGPDGTQAGYLYSRTIEGGRQFIGATLWQR